MLKAGHNSVGLDFYFTLYMLPSAFVEGNSFYMFETRVRKKPCLGFLSFFYFVNLHTKVFENEQENED